MAANASVAAVRLGAEVAYRVVSETTRRASRSWRRSPLKVCMDAVHVSRFSSTMPASVSTTSRNGCPSRRSPHADAGSRSSRRDVRCGWVSLLPHSPNAATALKCTRVGGRNGAATRPEVDALLREGRLTS